MSGSIPPNESRDAAIANWGDPVDEQHTELLHDQAGHELLVDHEHGDRVLRKTGIDYWTENATAEPGEHGPRRGARRFEVTTRYRGDQKVLPPEVLGSLAPYASIEHEVEAKTYTPLDANGEPEVGQESAPIEKEFVREHPLTTETATVSVLGASVGVEGTLTTLGYTVANPEADDGGGNPDALRAKDAHGQLISVESGQLQAIHEILTNADQVKKYDKGALGYCLQLNGADGEFGTDTFTANGRSVEVQYRRLSLDCEPNGTPKKLTIHFRWDGDTELPPT